MIPNNPMLNKLMSMRKSGGNPQAFLQQMIQGNPQIQQNMTQLRNMSNGMSGKDFAMQLAKQNGVSEQEMMNAYNNLFGGNN